MSNYLEDALVAHLNGTQLPLPANYYVALFTTATDDASGGTEVSGGSYARVAVSTAPGSGGRLMYSFNASDTDTAGDYIAEFTAAFIDGSKITAPHDGYIRVRVVADLDDE